MTTTYKVSGIYGKYTRFTHVLTSERLEQIKSEKGYTIESVEPYTANIRYTTSDGCAECMTNEYVPHYNCHCGANRAHCTSDYCY